MVRCQAFSPARELIEAGLVAALGTPIKMLFFYTNSAASSFANELGNISYTPSAKPC
jgi:hypothetical protein